MSRVYNFSAGPSCLPEEALKECAAEMLAYMQNARNQAKPLVEKYDKLTSVEDDLGQTKLQDIQNISVEHLSYEINDVKIRKGFSYTFEKGKKYCNIYILK